MVPDVTINDQLFWTDGFSGLRADRQPDCRVCSTSTLAAGTSRCERRGSVAAASTHRDRELDGPGRRTPLWTATFNGRTALTREQSFPASQASFGSTGCEIVGSSSAPAGSAASFDGFDVTYPRFYVARNNRLDCTSGGAAPIRSRSGSEGLVIGVAAAGLAYDVTDWNAPVRLTVADAQVVAKESTWRVFLGTPSARARSTTTSCGIDLPAIPDAAITAEAGSSLYHHARRRHRLRDHRERRLERRGPAAGGLPPARST